MTGRIDPLSEHLCFAIYSAGHALNRIYKPLLEALGLTYPQYLVMTVLWDTDGRTVGQLGERLFLDSSTLTPLLKRLEQAGQVQRERDKGDERVMRVRLTEAGRALQARAQSVPGHIVAASGQSAEAVERLKNEIEDLRDALTRFSRQKAGSA